MILIVEDEVALRENMQELLELSGYENATTANGEDALRWLKNNPSPSLIICDVMMPHMDGMELLETLRNEEDWATIPFLFLSAKVEKRVQEEGLEKGAALYMTKPFTHSELVANIEKLLARSN